MTSGASTTAKERSALGGKPHASREGDEGDSHRVHVASVDDGSGVPQGGGDAIEEALSSVLSDEGAFQIEELVAAHAEAHVEGEGDFEDVESEGCDFRARREIGGGVAKHEAFP